uniref:Uncharacterized protein n=1 Tax=Ciona intestinalis TaxID=7719 RepID=H2Y2J4_CIOIN
QIKPVKTNTLQFAGNNKVTFLGVKVISSAFACDVSSSAASRMELVLLISGLS